MFTKSKLRKLLKYYSTKNWKRLFKISKKLKKSKNIYVKADAYRYEGLALYKLKRFEEAEHSFTELTKLVSFRTDWFNLAMCFAQLGDIKNSEIAFQKIYASPPITGYKHQISVPSMIQLYAAILVQKKAWSNALSRISELKQMFFAANTDDEDKLLAMGLPTLKSFFELSMAVLKNHPNIKPEEWFGDIKRLKSVFVGML